MKKALSLLLTFGLTCSFALPASALEPEEAKELLRTHYVDSLPDNFEELETIEEILPALGDPHTDYLSSDEYEQMLQSVNGQSIVGIGIVIHTDFQNGYRIESVLPDSPAQQAGLSPGDTIAAVDGIILTASDDCRALILGEEGTRVSLTIRQQDGTLYSTAIIRQKVTIPIVTYEMIDDALVISCESFGDSTISTMKRALVQYEDQASVTIVDLRANPGGAASAATGSAGLFTGPGLMCYFRDGSGTYQRLYAPSSSPDLTDKAAIILLSPQSASGSELFSSAIRDYKAGISIGQRSYGKGSVQTLFDEYNYPELFDGDCLKLTTQRFFSPAGTSNHITGILPTLLISDVHTPVAVMLLTSPEPDIPNGFLKLELASQTFYIDLESAMREDIRPAFTELLESLPPSAALFRGENDKWISVTPAQLSDSLGISLVSRTFCDSTDSRYTREIDMLACYKLLSGYDDNTFRPNQFITRAEFCAMLCSALALPSSDCVSFSDVQSDSWYAGAVGAMAGKDFISGDETGLFRPNDTISYQEVVSILANVSAWISTDGYEYQKTPLSQSDQERYHTFSPWAQQAARNLNMFDALLPDISPTEPSTREIAAASLCRLMEYTGLIWN